MSLSRLSLPAVFGPAGLVTLLALTAAPASAQNPQPLNTPQAYEFPQIAPDTHGFSRMLAMMAAQQVRQGNLPGTYVGSISYRNYAWYSRPVAVEVPSTDATYSWRTRPVEAVPALVLPTDRTYAWYAPPGSGYGTGASRYENNNTWYVPAVPEQAAEPRYVSITGPDGRTRTFRLEGTVTNVQSAPVYVRGRTR